MSDFDPDAYLKEKTGAAFDPDAYLAAKAPAQAVAQPPKVGAGETFVNRAVGILPLGRQATQLGTTAALQVGKLFGVGKSGVRLGKASLDAGLRNDDTSTIPDVGDTYRQARQSFGERTDAGSEQNPWSGRAGTALGLGLSLGLPIAQVGQGLSGAIASGVLTGAGYGAAAGANDADLTSGTDTARRTLMGAGIGAATGVPAGLLSHGLSKLAGYANGKVAAIDQKVAQKAADAAAEETATARSLAGRTAQDAYKQLEHIRELGAMRSLTPDEAQAAAALEQELAGKAQSKLLPAIAAKEQAAQDFAKAAQTEGQRASAIAEDKLSGAELKRQVGARLLRYGLPALGGALGHTFLGGAVGAGGGALVGAGLRPMMHSLIRMAGQPVVQRPLFSGLARLASSVPEELAGPAALAAEQHLGEAMPGLLLADDEDTQRKARAQALRKAQAKRDTP